ncbi:MAG: chromate transporter, partial [Lentisphaeria bacterium]|nr:chromate transporter [Lentisphaeria bacterium]
SKKNKWLTSEELLDMMGLVQTVPGIIACNSAIYVGRRIAGLGGILAAAFGVCLPSVLIILMIAMFFPNLNPENPWLLGAFRGVRACITGLVMMTAFRMAKKVLKSWFEYGIALAALILVLLLKVEPVYVILGAMVPGVLYAWFQLGRQSRTEKGGGEK